MILSLLFIATVFAAINAVPYPACAADTLQWTAVNIPVEGSTGGLWKLANGSDIRYLTMANDGTLYCYANPAGTTHTLFKSTDGGRSWTTPGKVTDVIIDIAALPQDGATIYYATASRVYKSEDGGNTFVTLPPSPGGAGSGNVSISSIDVVRVGDGNTVAVSTIDTDAAQFGGVYLLEDRPLMGTWVNTAIGNYDVYRVAFSPNYNVDRQIIAIASNEVDTFAISKIYNGSWGQSIGNARIAGIVPSAANIAFPNSYNYLSGAASFFLGIDTGVNKGDVYTISSTIIPTAYTATDLHIGSAYGINAVDIAGLAISGSTILAGCADSAGVYLSNDGCISWTQCTRAPTGQSGTCILTVPDFNTQHKAYAVTRGQESAFSYSNDGGLTWNQISLIDTKISDIPDFTTPLPATTFMLTFNSENQKHSLWRTIDQGATWDRIYCSSFACIDNLKLMKTIPQYATDSPVILIAGQASNNPVIWQSNDNGQNFNLRAAPCPVDVWSIVDRDTWFIGGYDGGKGQVYLTNNAGNSYATPAEAGSQPLTAIAVSPDYPQDKTILTGNTVGQVYLSTDNGANFYLLGQQLPLATGTGKISLAFDPQFKKNKIIYAASDAKVTTTGRDRIFRFTVGKSTSWQSTYSALPDNAIIKQITISSDGTLYAVNNEAVAAADKKGGCVRSLNPTASAPAFETMLGGLDDAVTLNKLSICGNQLWTVDTRNMRLMTFIDNLVLPVSLVSPDDQAPGLDTTGLIIKWQSLNGATEYEWQVADNPGFTGIPAGLTGTAESSSARPTGLEPAATYYWRIRAGKPFLGRWSETWSFNTVLGGSNVVPTLSVPEAGAKTTVKPIFQWSTIAATEKYDLLVAKDAAFNNVVINKTGDNALPDNAWQSDVTLENNTTYYWKVKARSDKSFGAWSAVSVFITEPAPVIPASTETIRSTTETVTLPVQTLSSVIVPLPSDPQPVNVNVNISPLMYGGIILLAVIVITLTIAMITIKRRL